MPASSRVAAVPSAAVDVDAPTSSPLVAAVLASVGPRPARLGRALSRAEFRDRITASSRESEEAWFEIRRAALARETARNGRRRITGRQASLPELLRLSRLEAERDRFFSTGRGR